MSAQKYLGITLDSLRTRAGVLATDASKDAEIDIAFLAALDMMEVFLDRKLRFGTYTERLTHFFGAVASLSAYPIAQDKLTKEPVVAVTPRHNIFHVETETGLVRFDCYVREHQVEVVYDGGYEVLPSTLALALLLIFDAVWSSFAGGAIATGVVSRVTVPDVGTISYDTGAASAGAGSSGDGLIPPTAASMLQPYRRRLV
jgi:hypothetical protein